MRWSRGWLVGSVCGVLLICLLLVGFHVFLLDGLGGALLSSLSEDDQTYFASGYSDAGFRRVRKGMGEAEVLGLLGEPLRRYPVLGRGTVAWKYADQLRKGDHYVRLVIFSEGRVVKRRSEFYVD